MFRPRSWAVQLLVEPLITRFRHHFVGDPRPQSTNRLERPEWLTSFLLDAIQQHAPLIRQHVDPPARECMCMCCHLYRRAFLERLLISVCLGSRILMVRVSGAIIHSNGLLSP